MTPTMTPTPRTDAAEFPAHQATRCHYGEDPLVDADFARQLERENQTFRAAQKACENCDAPRVDRIAELERELAVWKHEVETLRDQLKAEHETAVSLFIELHELKERLR
jgi:hypothetical protein